MQQTKKHSPNCIKRDKPIDIPMKLEPGKPKSRISLRMRDNSVVFICPVKNVLKTSLKCHTYSNLPNFCRIQE